MCQKTVRKAAFIKELFDKKKEVESIWAKVNQVEFSKTKVQLVKKHQEESSKAVKLIAWRCNWMHFIQNICKIAVENFTRLPILYRTKRRNCPELKSKHLTRKCSNGLLLLLLKNSSTNSKKFQTIITSYWNRSFNSLYSF